MNPEILRKQSMREHIVGAANRLAGKCYNHDGCGGLAIRPDVLRLLLDACNGRPTLFDYGGAPMFLVELTGRGTVNLCFYWHPSRSRVLNLEFADGTTILHERVLPDGGRLQGVICHRMGGEAETAAEIADLFSWLGRGVYDEARRVL